MVTILTIESELESAKSLGYPTVLECDSRTTDTVIRWGNSAMPDGREFTKVVNTSKAIRLNCHKLRALEKMSEVVNTPKIYKQKVPSKKLALLRPFNHTGGEDFRVVTGPKDVPPEYYGTDWIKTKTEYRVWFAWDHTLCAKRVRVLPDGPDGKGWKNDTSPEPEFPCRSEWGYKFMDYVPNPLHADTIKAARLIGLDTGAADVLIRGEKYIFLELNSAPTVDVDRLRRFYQNAIDSKVK